MFVKTLIIKITRNVIAKDGALLVTLMINEDGLCVGTLAFVVH